MENENSGLKRFLDTAIAYQCGYEKPSSLDKICCFGLFKKYDYLINSRPENMDAAFVINKISSATSGIKTKELIEKIKGRHSDDSLFIIIDHDLKDAIFYQNGSKRKVIAAHLDSQMPQFSVNDVMEPFSRSMDEMRSLASCRTKTINGKEISFISVRRDMAKYLQLGKYGLDKNAKRDGITDTDLTMLTLDHEIGHSVYAKSRPPVPPMYAGYKFSERNEEECYADLYAAINSVKSRKDTKTVKLWADYRCEHTLKKVSLLMAMDGISHDEIAGNLIHDTHGALDAFVVFADKKLKEKPNYFAKLSPKQIDVIAKEFAKEYSLTDDRLLALVKETENRNIGKENKRLLKRRKQIFDHNGYNITDNAMNWEQMINEAREDLDYVMTSKDSEKIEHKVEKEFLAHLFAESEKKDYNTAFLNAYAATRKEIIEKTDTASTVKTEMKMRTLETILTEKQEKYKPAVAFHDYMRHIDGDKKYADAGKKELFREYIANKKTFLSCMDQVVADINGGGITDTTAKTFETALVSAAYAHYLAKRVIKKAADYPELEPIIKKDAKKEYPKELNGFFLSKTDSLDQLSDLIGKQTQVLHDFAAQKTGKDKVLSLQLKTKGKNR